MRSAVCITLLVGALAGCSTSVGDEVARAGARSAIDQVLAERFPRVERATVTPYTDCVINEASGSEITQLAADAITGVDQSTAEVVLGIARRQGAATCLLEVGFAQAF